LFRTIRGITLSPIRHPPPSAHHDDRRLVRIRQRVNVEALAGVGAVGEVMELADGGVGEQI